MTVFDTCEHPTKTRLLGADPRLWQCVTAPALAIQGCDILFVEGRSWRGEPKWIRAAAASASDFDCTNCLDGLCTSVDDRPCRDCGTHSARPKADVGAENELSSSSRHERRK